MSDELFDTRQGADYISGRQGRALSPATLVKARHTGDPAYPPFVRIGRSVFYRKSDLDNWLANLPRFRSTAEAKLANAAQMG